ncbi:DUF4143 domain-containing protein [Nonomuraea sp. SYSU D8015]|uniref:DUF4143 domain-containing protein n=1 Tax=Nonomuraea sp. SYSU D8015 TaxID=2593644 RepID=UPI0021D1634A|nr:DUF4143 domain-containing protein [Nonomuraea sp. SYSU D8015]
MWPFAEQELNGGDKSFLERAFDEPESFRTTTQSSYGRADYFDLIARGFYPRGPLVETFIANELAKQATWAPYRLNLFHWRVSQGAEVDLVVERTNGRVIGVEAKATDAVDLKDFKGLTTLRDALGEEFVHGFVLYTGKRSLAFGDRLTALPISALWDR